MLKLSTKKQIVLLKFVKLSLEDEIFGLPGIFHLISVKLCDKVGLNFDHFRKITYDVELVVVLLCMMLSLILYVLDALVVA